MLNDTSPRYLPARVDGFVLWESEPLSAGLQRVTIDQFDHSIALLTSGADVDAAVHEARKSMKRLRAVLRLIRSEIGDKAYRTENAILRDTARMLAPMRDGHVMAMAVTGLRKDFEGQLSTAALAGLEEALWMRHRARRARTLADEALFPHVIATLSAARNRYAAWPTEVRGISTPDPYGRNPIADRFGSIERGLCTTYGRGRAEMDRASAGPTAHRFHQWRKRVKYLRHQMELLDPLWPEMMSTYAMSLHDLGELLGEEHDLAVLVELLAGDRSLRADPTESGLATALAEYRRKYLQQAAVVMGHRIYAETPERFAARIGSYWGTMSGHA